MQEMNKKILIVEDEDNLLAILKTKFEEVGFLILIAEDGEQGIAVAQKGAPDLILSDILIPKIDGVNMAIKIRESGNKVPIVFLTNTKDSDYIGKMGELGFEYLIKSEHQIDEIISRVKKILDIK